MSEYIDLVICETCNGKRELFQAPRFSHLKNGDMVIVENDAGEGMTNVVASVCLRLDETEDVEFIKESWNIHGSLTELARIKSKIILRNLEYKEDYENDL